MFSRNTVLIIAIISIFVYCAWYQNFRKELKISWMAVVIISVLHCVVGLACSRILAIVEVGGRIESAAKIRLFGAIFFLPIFYYLGAKLFHRNVNRVLDIASITLVMGIVFGRIDCLIGGCCNGFLIPGSNTLHWPIREIELIYYGIFLIYYYRKVLRSETHGEICPIFMIQYGVLRFLLEWFRLEYTSRIGILRLAHVWCIISVVIGLVWLLILRKKEAKVIS